MSDQVRNGHAGSEKHSRERALVVSVEPLWPCVSGGRLRTAKLAEQVASRMEVHVVAPATSETAAAPAGITQTIVESTNWSRMRRLRHTLSVRPRLGNLAMSSLSAVLEGHVRQADVVIWSHDYMAAAASRLGPPEVIDIQNIEILRLRSFADRASGLPRLSRRVEQWKASQWEPRVWRRADALLAILPEDVCALEKVTDRVVLAPVGAHRQPYVASPDEAPVLMVGSFGYEPNRMAAHWLVEEVWPLVRARRQGTKAILAGRSARQSVGGLNAPDVGVVSDFSDPRELYERSAVVVAPVTTGAGAQLKVAEGLAANRVLVATPFSARSATSAAVDIGLCQIADGADAFADTIVHLLDDPVGRRRIEEAASHAHVVPTWDEALKDAVETIYGLATRRRLVRTEAVNG
jgi:glycosyltransferase involved in cell wall biosynthesis